MYICTKIARQMDANGLNKVFDAADTATAAIEEARPLLENAVKLVDEVSPKKSCLLLTPTPCLFASCAVVQSQPIKFTFVLDLAMG